LITKHGKVVARLTAAQVPDLAQVDATVTKLKALRQGVTLGGLSWKELRDDGRTGIGHAAWFTTGDLRPGVPGGRKTGRGRNAPLVTNRR